MAVGRDSGVWGGGTRREQLEIDILAHVFGLWKGRVPEPPQLAILPRFDQPVDMIGRKRLNARMRTAQRHRFKPGHFALRSLSRHCEEPPGRANARPLTGSATK